MASTRLLAILSSDPDGPVVRHRWGVHRAALEEAGVVTEVVAWPKPWRGRRRAMHRAATADGVIVSSRLLRRRDTRRLRHAARRLAFDFDDALPFRHTADGATPSATRHRRFRALARQSDAVFAGNEHLASLAQAEGVDCEVIPSVVEVGPPPPPPPPDEAPFVLGWIGSAATLPYLEEHALTLSAVVASRRAVRLRAIADRRARMPPGIPVEHVPWTPGGWRRALAGIHVGLAPLPDDPWTRGKCGLKVLQMMEVGRPVVASDVGVQHAMIEPGVTGLLAPDRESFLEALFTLLDDADLRRRMGEAAREAVVRNWSADAWSPRVVKRVTAWLS